MKFGQKVKSRREELKLTQEELAGKIRTTQPYISRLERGHFNPSMNMIVKISSSLSVSTDYLLSEETGFPDI